MCIIGPPPAPAVEATRRVIEEQKQEALTRPYAPRYPSLGHRTPLVGPPTVARRDTSDDTLNHVVTAYAVSSMVSSVSSPSCDSGSSYSSSSSYDSGSSCSSSSSSSSFD